MFIIGISAFYHDSAACLVKDGEILSGKENVTTIGRELTIKGKALASFIKITL